MNLTDTQVAIVEQYCKGQIGDNVLEDTVPGHTAARWMTLKEELNPSDLESAYETFHVMQQSRRITIEGPEQDDDPFGLR